MINTVKIRHSDKSKKDDKPIIIHVVREEFTEMTSVCIGHWNIGSISLDGDKDLLK